MRKAGLGALLWRLFFLSDLQVAAESEEKYVLFEGQTLQASCPFTIWKHANSRMALQRLIEGMEPRTLAITEKPSGVTSKVQEGRYFLEAIYNEAILNVHVSNLRVEDTGLYRCVIFHPLKEPYVLTPLIRLEVIKDPSSTSAPNKEIIENVSHKSTLSSTISTLSDKDLGTVTQLPPTSTVLIFSPGLGVTLTNVTDARSKGLENLAESDLDKLIPKLI
ncbi:triggering receptor expressed on myeloid cells 1-like [Suncus etruscus]|uniref:triggering receptor expressed on myeloid cells 1-like n=1 Tax=Suncus etruscus TaxID=109475 RepID=UPI00210F379B|nr:triggering receptor expressed on myeloid cells 1-like [Suncus etruscus]